MTDPNYDPFEDGTILDVDKTLDSYERILKDLCESRNRIERQIHEVKYIIELIEKDKAITLKNPKN